jgi:hypothetical protein
VVVVESYSGVWGYLVKFQRYFLIGVSWGGRGRRRETGEVWCEEELERK